MFLATFSGGSIPRIARTLLWVFLRSGANPMADVLFLLLSSILFPLLFPFCLLLPIFLSLTPIFFSLLYYSITTLPNFLLLLLPFFFQVEPINKSTNTPEHAPDSICVVSVMKVSPLSSLPSPLPSSPLLSLPFFFFLKLISCL